MVLVKVPIDNAWVYLDYLKEPSDLYFLDEYRLTQVTNSGKLSKKILKEHPG